MTKALSYLDYRKLWANIAQNLQIPSVPIHIDLELTRACNLSCAMCPASLQKNGNMMDFHMAQSILKEAAKIGVSSVKMNWRGEPTLYPHFEQISKIAHSLGFVDIMLNTNGMYTNESVKNAFYNYYTTIVFSIDAYDSEIYKASLADSNPDLIFHNLGLIGQSYDLYKKPEFLVINHVRQKKNWNEYEILKQLCKDTGVKFRAMLAFPRTDIELHDEKHMPKILGRKPCPFPFQRLTIGYDGNVYPCCCLWDDDDRLCLGNVNTDSLMDIWNGDLLKEIREQQKCGIKANFACNKKCVSWVTYKTDKPTLFNSYEKSITPR